MTFYIQPTIEDVAIKAESDITTVGAGYGNVEIAGLGDLRVSTKPISERTDGKGNNSSYLRSYKLICFSDSNLTQYVLLSQLSLELPQQRERW